MRISDWSSDVCSSDLLAGYEAVDCIDVLKDTTMEEQVQMKAFLHSGDCTSLGSQLLAKFAKTSRDSQRCPVTSALQLHCQAESTAWNQHKRAAHVFFDGFTKLTEVFQAEAQAFMTDLEADRAILSEIEENLSRPFLACM